MAAASCRRGRLLPEGEKEDAANGGRIDESRDAASAYFKKDVSRDDAATNYEVLRRPLGAIKQRTFKSSEFDKAPDGEYPDIVFDSGSSNRNAATETVELVREADGAWKSPPG